MLPISKDIIACVRNYPFLYDRSHEKYNDTTKKNNAWRQIASDVNLKMIVARRKWKSIRDKYVQYLKQRGNSKMSKYRALQLKEKWKPMQFLERHVRPKAGFPRQSRKEETEPPVAQQGSDADPDATEHRKENWKPMQFFERPLQPKAGFPRESRKKETGPPVTQQGSNADPDATELMFRSFAKSVRNMRCPVMQAKVKLQIMEIITDAMLAIDPNGLKDPVY